MTVQEARNKFKSGEYKREQESILRYVFEAADRKLKIFRRWYLRGLVSASEYVRLRSRFLSTNLLEAGGSREDI